MPRQDLEKEKQCQLAAIWGSEVAGAGGTRCPRRRGAGKRVFQPGSTARKDDTDIHSELSSLEEEDDCELRGETAHNSTFSMDSKDGSETTGSVKQRVARKARKPEEYRLHCFVEPGTELNAVRTVFEAYEPKVELRTAQKGNLLNRAQYAVLTFRNKALALHAVKMLDGSNQRDYLGVSRLKLNLMLDRRQSKMVRKRLNEKRRRESADRESQEALQDREFIQQFLRQHMTRKSASCTSRQS